MDADRASADESVPGHDTFRELAVAFGVNEAIVESISVIDDGSESGEGIIRVIGRPTATSLAPQASYLSQNLVGTITTDYILRPDVDYVELKTTLNNEADDQVYGVLYFDFIAFGAAGKIHTPTTGFADLDLFTKAPYLAMGGRDQASYAYVCSPGDDATVLFANAGVSGAYCRDDAILAKELTYSRYLVIGDGSLESLAKPAYALRGDEVGTVRGVVSDALMQSDDAELLVTALSSPLDQEGSHVVNQARATPDGNYELTLPPGDYTIMAHIESGPRTGGIAVTVEANQDIPLDFSLPGAARLHVVTAFLDRDGTTLPPQPAKLSVIPLEQTQRPSQVLREYTRGGLTTYQPTADGVFDVALPPGQYRILVSRGFEFSRTDQEVTLTAGQTLDVQAQIQHVMNTDGLISAEFHQHSLGSVDATTPIPIKVLENAAEGLEIACSTDHDNITDFRPYVEAFGLTEHLFAMAGNEVSYQSIGHFNVYPWQIDPDDPYSDIGSRAWWQKTVPLMFADARAAAGDPIVQVNHPRKLGAGYLSSMRFNPVDATRFERGPPMLPTLPPDIYQKWTSEFEAIEVNAGLGQPEDFLPENAAVLADTAENNPGAVPGLADYFGLLGAGMPVAAMGNSDSHNRNAGVGYPRNFLRLPATSIAELNEADIKAAIKAQHVSVGEGCLVTFDLDGKHPMGMSEAITTEALANLRVHVQAPPHVVIDRIELYRNGHIVKMTLQDGTLRELSVEQGGVLSVPIAATTDVTRVDAPLALEPTVDDLALVAVARGPSGLAPTGGSTPFCFTAPLYVDGGATGWEGWLAATQQIR